MAKSLYRPKLTEHEAKANFAQTSDDFTVLAFISIVLAVIQLFYTSFLVWLYLSSPAEFWTNNNFAFAIYGMFWLLLMSFGGLTIKVYSQLKYIKQIVATKDYTRYGGPFLGGI